jgi:recombination protein RecA
MARAKKTEVCLSYESKDQERRALITKYNKEAGERLIGSLKEEAINGYSVISTGIPSLDIKLGSGGVPKGRVTEIYGPNQAGKTTIALQMAANVYKAGGTVIYVDAEYALDVNYAIALGLDVEDDSRFLLVQPDYGEQGFNAIYSFMKKGLVDLVIVDSYPMMTPYAAIMSAEENGFEKTPAVALSARMWGFFLDKTLKYIKRNNIAFVVLNQERVVAQGPSLGTGRAGGNVLKHVDFITIQMRSKASNYDGDGDIEKGTYDGKSRKSVAFIVKNKMASPYRSSVLQIDFGKGVNYYIDLLDVANEYKAGVSIGGAGWITFLDENGEELQKIQGKEAAADLLATDKELITKILDIVEEKTAIRLFNPLSPLDKYGRVKDMVVNDTVEVVCYEDDGEDELFTEDEINKSIAEIATIEEKDYDPIIVQDVEENNNSLGL